MRLPEDIPKIHVCVFTCFSRVCVHVFKNSSVCVHVFFLIHIVAQQYHCQSPHQNKICNTFSSFETRTKATFSVCVTASSTSPKKWLRIRLMAILQYASLTILFAFQHFLMTARVPMTFWELRRVQIYFHAHAYTYTPHCEHGPDFALNSNTAISFTVRIAMCVVSCIHLIMCTPQKGRSAFFPSCVVSWVLSGVSARHECSNTPQKGRTDFLQTCVVSWVLSD